MATAKAKVFREAVAANAVRTVRPADYEALAAGLSGPDPDDLWHLAAATAAGATVIVTENTTDFTGACVPDDFTMPRIATPAQLFSSLIADGLQDDLLTTIARMSARLKNPPRTPSEIIEGLAVCGLKVTATALRTRLAQSEETD